MKKKTLAGAAMLALAVSLTTSAVAFEHKAGRSGSHVARVHAGGMRSFAARHSKRFARIRGFESAAPAGWQGGSFRGGFIDLGPLGITAACGLRCSQGYSVPAWTY
jgi:hypothetical protein